MEDEILNSAQVQNRLIDLTRLCTEFCYTLENCSETDKEDFINRMLNLLPRIYWNFFDITVEDTLIEDYGYFQSYVDEDYYESIRRHIESLLGEEDVYLETFEEDMKYSESPLPASIAESLADIFQPLFNFVSIVKDSEGEKLVQAYFQCKEDFESYWSQTLCNVLRAINHIKYNSSISRF